MFIASFIKMKLASLIYCSTLALAVALPPVQTPSIKTLDVREDVLFDADLPKIVEDAVEILRESLQSLLTVGRAFSMYVTERGLNVPAYYCQDPEVEIERQSMNEDDLKYLESYRMFISSAGLDVKEMYCSTFSKRDGETTLFFGIPRLYWDFIVKKAKGKN